MSVKLEKLELERLASEAGGVLTVDAVLEAAAHPDSPLHDSFEWADDKAAANWRRVQARILIQRVNITVAGNSPQVVRAFVSLPDDRMSGGGYRLMTAVISDDVLRAELLSDIANTVNRWQRKMHLIDAEIVDLLARVGKKVEKKRQRPGADSQAQAA
jgi:hypothetical protein